jgi:mono/diheme cytochrome c family protein
MAEEPQNLDTSLNEPDRDIAKMHSAILREKVEPQEGAEPLPVWLVLMFCVIVFWSGGYLCLYCGGFRGDVFDETQITWGYVKGGGAAVAEDPVALGKKVFTANCAACHQASGTGIPGQYPPLAGSEIVLSKEGYGPNHIARIVLNGLSGPVTVKGSSFNGNMPTWKDILSDEQIANVLTYVRQEWGNNAPPISKDGIAAVRAVVASRPVPWTLPELKAIPAADLPSAAPAKPAPAAAPAPAEKKK